MGEESAGGVVCGLPAVACFVSWVLCVSCVLSCVVFDFCPLLSVSF